MKRRLFIDELTAGLGTGDVSILARAITLVESTLPSDREQAGLLIHECLRTPRQTMRVAITGVPGVGKSTFIESLGTHIIEACREKVAVLAIDPSSPLSGGSIMGDKTRMPRLSASPRAFIRPTPSRGGLGGVHQRTRETILLCEAAGFRNVIIETVGVGQSEVAAASMTDFFLLLLLANAGDELQGVKRGILEVCDLVAINKADGDNVQAAELARRQHENALRMLPGGRHPQVLTCSGLYGIRIAAIWSEVIRFEAAARASGAFEQRRRRQLEQWTNELFESLLRDRIESNNAARHAELREAVLAGRITPAQAAHQMVDAVFNPESGGSGRD